MASVVRSLWMLFIRGLLITTQSAPAAESTKLSRAEAGLVAAETQRFNAQIASDVAALKLAMADELIYTHATGRVQNKQDYLQGFESGSARYKAIDIADRVVHANGNLGMTAGTITLTVGNDMKLVSRYTGVYAKRAGRWQLLAWQATDIRAPSGR